MLSLQQIVEELKATLRERDLTIESLTVDMKEKVLFKDCVKDFNQLYFMLLDLVLLGQGNWQLVFTI